jgi:hypothetical protein
MSHPALGPPPAYGPPTGIGITYHKTDAKTARVLFDDPVGNLERIRQTKEQGSPGSIFNDLANPKQPKSKVGHKPALEKYIPKIQSDEQKPEKNLITSNAKKAVNMG